MMTETSKVSQIWDPIKYKLISSYSRKDEPAYSYNHINNKTKLQQFKLLDFQISGTQ